MNIVPFGPPRPKKPKAKRIDILVDQIEVYGWISCDEIIETDTEIFSVNEEGEYCQPLDGFYTLVNGDTFEVLNGKIA
jgi:hypothetical protein